MKLSELEQGRRVRLTVDLEGGRHRAGDTGELACYESIHGGITWGVRFDHNADRSIHVSNEKLDGTRVKLVDVVELIQPVADDDLIDFCEVRGHIPTPNSCNCYICGTEVTPIDREPEELHGACDGDYANDLSEDTQKITPIDQQFLEAEQEMELIRQLAIAQDAINRVKQGPMTDIGVDGFLDLCDDREQAINALIKFCRGRWLTDPVYAPIGGD